MNARRETKLAPISFHPSTGDSTNAWPGGSPRRAISHSIVFGVVRLLDMACVLLGGCVASFWLTAAQPLAFQPTVLFIALATIAMMNIAPAAGAYRQEML